MKSTTHFGAVTDCNSPDVVCPLRTDGTFNTMCDCFKSGGSGSIDNTCSVCYGAETETNFKCTSRQDPDCTQSYQTCTDPNVVCPPLISKIDPWGTRCNCLTNSMCSICVTQPASDVSPATLKCVSTQDTIQTCSSTTKDCNDATIMCPTRLTCNDCKSLGCTWCGTGDMGFTSKCVAGTTCPSPFVVESNCNDNCFSNTDCTSCQNNGCTWCENTDVKKATCMKYCDATTSSQTAIQTCSSADKCYDSPTCDTCILVGGCTWCEGRGRHDGSSTGRFCTSAANCNNLAGCGVWQPCVATPYTDTCPITNTCDQYQTCKSCQGQSDVAQKCYWCDKDGTRYCDSTCITANAVKVASCAYFGANGEGQTGMPSTGDPGTTPSGFIPPDTPGVPPAGPAPATPSSPSGTTPGTPSSPSGTTPGTPSSPSGTTPGTPSSPSGTGPSTPGTNPSGDISGSARTGSIDGFNWALFGIILGVIKLRYH